MSDYQQKPNSGSLFKNDRKDSERHPDKTGTALIGGVEYRVSAWDRQTKKGDSWLSLAFTQKEGRAPAKEPEPTQQSMPIEGDAPFNDDIPF